MKNFFILSLCMFGIGGLSAQNEPELLFEFSDAGFDIHFVMIDHDMPKLMNKSFGAIHVYNLDFTLYGSFDLPTEGLLYTFLVTRSLFDCDTTQLEVLITGQTPETLESYTKIIREDGSEYFSLPGWWFSGFSTVTQDPTRHGVVSDELGSYIYFQSIPSSPTDLQLYRFCGQVPQMLARDSEGNILGGRPGQAGRAGFSIFPNPGKDQIRLEYDLQGHPEGLLSVYSTTGQLVKEARLGPTFKSILLDISGFKHGTYIARISSKDGFQLSEKFVKVE